ncbi:MAG TPA: TonB-dependent receptor [Terracidiphilus sp.]|nr:TonB-dependent receptor [Terracidiphilus sp.]
MRTVKRIAIYGALALMLAGPGDPGARLCAQAREAITITVEDESGAALAGALVTDSAGHALGITNGNGSLTVNCAEPCSLTISAHGFATQDVAVAPGASAIHLRPAETSEQVTVTAYGAPLGTLESPASTRVLSEQALNHTAAVTLDGKLRQLPGVELFRRSSSLVANPTSQGISLRGLGSTAASRTLVMEDDVPLNDPIGGWIHWQEVPELAIRDVELVRGGASDLYGSSAIGGVISILPVRPTSNDFELRGSYGGEDTFDESLLAETKHGPWGVLAAGGLIGTNGYIEIAPAQRGPIDHPSNVHSQNGLFMAEHDRGPLRIFARASGFDESRHNGTPYQMNNTRLIRYASGGDWQDAKGAAISLRLYGSTERYRQTFSQILNTPAPSDAGCTYRCRESPTKLTRTSDDELGGALKGSRPFGAGLLLMSGADVHDVRVWDREQSFFGAGALTNLHDHQRDPAVWAELMWVRNAWTVAASGRMDWFQNYDGHQVQWNGAGWIASSKQPPQNAERLFDPRVGISRRIASRWAVSASGFRAFRAPTPSELYRATQVGDKLTDPNGSLLSERATGWETGVATTQSWGSARVSYFLTQVNRPITAFTVNPNSSPILLVRENLGQIESRGVSADFELAPRRWLAVDGGYQYAHAVVSRGSQDYGKWIPEVARNMATMNVRAFKPSLGVLSLQGRYSGRMFDDDANLFPLSGFFRIDAYVSHQFGRIELFAAGENLTNAQIEVSKTPETTLGQPRVGRIGFLFRLGEMAR